MFGCVLIGLGVWLEIQDQAFRILVDKQEFLYGPYLIIAAGCAIILVSGIGMVGALCETKINKFLLGFVSFTCIRNNMDMYMLKYVCFSIQSLS